jgi:pilus assembly protein CpaF
MTEGSGLNLLLSALVILLVAGFAARRLSAGRNAAPPEEVPPQILYSLDSLLTYVRERMHELTRTNLHELGLDEAEYRKRENKREELVAALRRCTYGDLRDKQYVKDVILDMLEAHVPPEYLDVAVPFGQSDRMTGGQGFACRLHQYSGQQGAEAFSKLVDAHRLDALRPLDGEPEACGYVISDADIRRIYRMEGVLPTRADKLEILTQMVYERFKGLGPVDELRDMNIDGLSGGVSGVTDGRDLSGLPKSHNSVWVFHRGKSIRMACLGFGSERELRRVCQNIYRFNKAGQLSESVPFRVGEMADAARIVVVRPPFSESWAFFVRKFLTVNLELEKLITDQNAALPVQMIRFLAKGCMITALTGSQGSGKTTLLMEMIRHIDATYPLRIQEMSFELHLRRLYPERNILSFRETETISGQAGLDLQKKTDGTVNILGEVATDVVAAWMIQMAQVASLFTLFTHHAKTTEDLVLNLRNALLKCEMFSNETIAEQQVASVLDFDIHLARDPAGHRYIERITEVIATVREQPYPDDWRDEADPDAARHRFRHATQAFYERMTDRRTHVTRNIIEYRDGAYHAVHRPSRKHVLAMAGQMRPADASRFLDWVDACWPVTGPIGQPLPDKEVAAHAG